jgi:hypothetical protein
LPVGRAYGELDLVRKMAYAALSSSFLQANFFSNGISSLGCVDRFWHPGADIVIGFLAEQFRKDNALEVIL